MRNYKTLIAIIVLLIAATTTKAQFVTVSFVKTDTVNIGDYKGYVYPQVTVTNPDYRISSVKITMYSMLGAGDVRFHKDGPLVPVTLMDTNGTILLTQNATAGFDTLRVHYYNLSGVTHCTAGLPFWLICPNVVTDTAYIPMRIEATVTDIVTANVYNVDIPLTAIYYSDFVYPSYLQQVGLNLNVVTGDWSGSIDNYVHIIYASGSDSIQTKSDTTIALWSYLATKGVYDTCVEIYFSRGGDWCSIGNQIICSTTPASVSNVSKPVLHLWPNPTSDRLYWSEKLHFTLTSLEGKKILEGKDNNVDLQSLSSGVYILHTDKGKYKVLKN